MDIDTAPEVRFCNSQPSGNRRRKPREQLFCVEQQFVDIVNKHLFRFLF